VAWDRGTGTQLDELNTVQNRRVTRVSPKIRGELETSAPFLKRRPGWDPNLDRLPVKKPLAPQITIRRQKRRPPKLSKLSKLNLRHQIPLEFLWILFIKSSKDFFGIFAAQWLSSSEAYGLVGARLWCFQFTPGGEMYTERSSGWGSAEYIWIGWL